MHIYQSRWQDILLTQIDSGGEKMYSTTQIREMVEFLIDNFFVKFGGHLFSQVVGIPMCTNCASPC